MNHDFKTVRGKAVFIIGVAIDFICVTLINQFTIYEGVLGFIYIFIYILYSAILLDGTIKKKLFASITAVLVLILVGAVVSSFVSIISERNLALLYGKKITERIYSVVGIQILTIVIYDLILKYSVSSLKKREWNLVISILVISFISMAFIHLTLISTDIDINYTRMIMASELGIIVLNIVCFYMTYALSKSNSETEALREQKQQDEYRAHYAENIKNQYEEMRRIRHDMKQNLTVISALYKEGKYKEACKYADKISDNLTKFDILIDVGNDFINAILNSKLSIAKEHGIEVLCVSSSNIGGVEDTDLCNLLGNMLDNAIEAAEKCNNSFIEVSLNSDEYKIHVMISNSIKESVFKHNCNLVSTKNDNNTHGYGIKTIKSIAEKYGGIANFYEDENMFYCQVIMYKQKLRECDLR